MTTNIFSNILSPSVRVVESTQGYRSLEIASHQTVYMIGSAETGATLTPTQVISLEDFTNVFGASPSENAVKLFFRNDRRGILYFINAPIAKRFTVTVDTATQGADYTVTINGVDVTYTAQIGDTVDSIASELISAVNLSAEADTVTASSGAATDELVVRVDDPLDTSLTVTVNANMSVADSTPNSPSSIDYVYAIENSFDVEDAYEQGFLIAPEAFTLLTDQSDRLSVGLAMEAHASNDQFDWVALIDAGASLTPVQAKAEGLLYNSPQGHSSFFYPHLVDLEDGVVPASAGVAGVATRRFKDEGFQQPPAGAKFPVLGVKDVVTKVSTQVQDTLNPDGINVVRNLRNKGVVVWGMRTRSSSEFYKFINTRVIMNVLNGTLRKGFDNELFSVIDGQGVLLNSISQTAAKVCSRLWRGKALFGATEVEAFEVKCDFENNTPEELEQGNVLLEVYVVPAPAMEKLLISTIRVSIGTLPQNENQVAFTPLN
ncbi:phage tail sheath subtilisin-like domain-containing protein [Picosynechococcus sp. PCC 7117]|uniref:phage tail sheath subtilisin-like domain-containing protein n=1 Tax=Picosynechococcus sp. PCC 7117 TaxID=195498 RepID=UPI00081035EF|nr:phage tail sheath subtilisin-like domain-containing protein [Picosynechococcus sp. PCC 7117]ANV88493.1 hypothetical protein AWQ22_14055 [Picosynechococcus sp. PCC 7117]